MKFSIAGLFHLGIDTIIQNLYTVLSEIGFLIATSGLIPETRTLQCRYILSAKFPLPFLSLEVRMDLGNIETSLQEVIGID